MIGSGLALLALVTSQGLPDSLRLLAGRLPEASLVEAVRAQPVAVREALSEMMALAVNDRDPSARDRQLAAARRLAAAYATAWRDSFLVREVARFAASSPSRRAAKVRVDSVRRAAAADFGRAGPRAAMAGWRRAYTRARAISDTAGIAAVLGNIGVGFLAEDQLDSAGRYLGEARRLAAAVGDIRVEANALVALAEVDAASGNHTPAQARYRQGLDLHQRIGDSRGVAADYNNLGLMAREVGDLAEARRYFERALALNRQNGRDEIAATNLVNLAGLASLAGDLAAAAVLYQSALASWRAAGEVANSADALRGLGQVELRRGEYRKADAALGEALAIRERTGPLAETLALQRELAAVRAATGQLQGAVHDLRTAARRADSAGAPTPVRAGIALARADLAAQLNDLAEAERLYAQAASLFRRAEARDGEAEAKQGQGVLALAQGNYSKASAALDAAHRAQVALGSQRAAAVTRISLAELARARGDTAGARHQLVRVAADFGRLGDPIGHAATLGRLGALDADAGRPAAAEVSYRAGLGLLRDRVAPDIAWELRTGLGLARKAQGATAEAVRELRLAVAEVERTSRSLALPERRSGFLADKGEAYLQLALAELELGRPGAAFEVSERLRAREMHELMARGRVAAADTAADLVGREQDLRRQIGELTRRLAGPLVGGESLRGPDVGRVGSATREALLGAQEAYAALLLEIRERAPAHAAVVAAEITGWRAASARLGSDEALIEYLLSDSMSVAFVIVRDTMAMVDLSTHRRELARLTEFVRGTLEPRGSVRMDSLWRGPLRRLHRHLVAPIEETGLLAGKARLVLVPHGELHFLPFAALQDDTGRFLIERYEISVTPSASVWVALGDRRRDRPGTGVLAMAPRPDALPASRREVAAIGRQLGRETQVLTAEAATEAVFRRDAPSRRMLHLATYGVLNQQNPLFSFVELAPGGGHDGRLEVHEVFGLRLTADLVVLSACQTGLGSGTRADVPVGDDWVGLTRAFLHAGASQVMATLWPVEDWATAGLMERFYREFGAGVEPRRALAAAQRATLVNPTTAHPFYWAGFVVAHGSGPPRASTR